MVPLIVMQLGINMVLPVKHKKLIITGIVLVVHVIIQQLKIVQDLHVVAG